MLCGAPGKGLTSWLSFVVSNCEFVTFPLVSWIRYGALLYCFLIFAPLLTLRGPQRTLKLMEVYLVKTFICLGLEKKG